MKLCLLHQIHPALRATNSANDNDGVSRAQIIEFSSILRKPTAARNDDERDADIIVFRSVVNGPWTPPTAA